MLKNTSITIHTIQPSRNDIFEFTNLKKDIASQITLNEVGCAGHSELAYLEDTLDWLLNDSQKNSIHVQQKELYDKEQVSKVILGVFKKCQKHLTSKNTTHVYVFPTWSDFVREKMDGVSGFTPWKNTIIIGLYGNSINVQELERTISHEYTHSLSYEKWTCSMVDTAIIFEGLAEVFSETIMKSPSTFTKVFDKKQAFTYYKSLPKELRESTDTEKQRELFTGGKIHPLWAGYAIGYYLVKDYIHNNPIRWQELINKDPQKILKKNHVVLHGFYDFHIQFLLSATARVLRQQSL